MDRAEAPRQPAWAELALVTALAAGVLAYLIEARGVSLDPQNLLLLQPTAWLVLGLWAVIAAGCLMRRADPAAPRESAGEILRVLAASGWCGRRARFTLNPAVHRPSSRAKRALARL
ncbi:MAG: hypothetical protein ACK4ST_16260 [Elioraea tepidiphila]